MTSFLNRFGLTKKRAKRESGIRREGQDESPILPQIRTLGTVRSHSRNRTFTVWNDVRPLRSDEERYVYVTVAPAGSSDGETERRRGSLSVHYGAENQIR